MTTWLIILGIITVLALYGHQLSLGAGRKASIILKRIDTKYDRFVDAYISNIIVHEDRTNIDQEEILQKLQIILKPEIDGLIAFINSNDLSDVRVRYDSKYFDNLSRIAESLFQKRHTYQSHPISQDDEEKLQKALLDAIKADLLQRTLLLRGGLG